MSTPKSPPAATDLHSERRIAALRWLIAHGCHLVPLREGLKRGMPSGKVNAPFGDWTHTPAALDDLLAARGVGIVPAVSGLAGLDVDLDARRLVPQVLAGHDYLETPGHDPRNSDKRHVFVRADGIPPEITQRDLRMPDSPAVFGQVFAWNQQLALYGDAPLLLAAWLRGNPRPLSFERHLQPFVVNRRRKRKRTGQGRQSNLTLEQLEYAGGYHPVPETIRDFTELMASLKSAADEYDDDGLWALFDGICARGNGRPADLRARWLACVPAGPQLGRFLHRCRDGGWQLPRRRKKRRRPPPGPAV